MSTLSSPPETGATLKELRKQANELYKEIRKLELEEKIEEARHYLGRMFTLKNSYGGKSEPWDVYFLVYGVSEEGSLRCYSFQLDSMGRLEIETRKILPDLNLALQEITLAEFQTAWLDVAIFITENHPNALAVPVAHVPRLSNTEKEDRK